MLQCSGEGGDGAGLCHGFEGKEVGERVVAEGVVAGPVGAGVCGIAECKQAVFEGWQRGTIMAFRGERLGIFCIKDVIWAKRNA